ncbi:MAG TPA: hypothetical protein PLU73_11465 [Bacteroidia bacterium]|nr:hypothetical protein [Bacteroidia bacterium]
MAKYFFYIFLVSSVITLSSCVKKEVPKYGCKDVEANNYDPTAYFDNGGCVYNNLILDPSFETGDWSIYSGTGYSYWAGSTSVADGFMPTHGKSYLKCVPFVDKLNGTLIKQYLGPNKHKKGFYFDYSYRGIAGNDSLLVAQINISDIRGLVITTLFSKTISESYISLGSIPNVYIQKKDAYVELPYSENHGLLTITTNVSKGTFTFCIDNIREVQK